MTDLYPITAGPSGQAMTEGDFWRAATSQPFSMAQTLGQGTIEGALGSFGAGTLIRGGALPPRAPQVPGVEGLGAVMDTSVLSPEDKAGIEANRQRQQAEYDRQYGVLTDEQQKASADFRPNIGVQAGMTPARQAAMAEWNDAKEYRARVLDRSDHPLIRLTGNLLGGAIDPINYIPVIGPEVRAAAVARWGFGGAMAVSAADAALNTGLAAAATGSTRQALGDEVSWQGIVSQMAMGAVIGGAFGGAAHAFGGWRASRVVNSLENVMKSRAVLNEAIDGVVRGEDIALSPAAVDEIAFWKNDPVRQKQVADIVPPEAAPAVAPIVKPPSLIDFLSRIGIKDEGGELAHMGIGDLFIPGRGRIVRKNGGVTLDQAREMAVQAGYLQDAGWNNADVQSNSTVDDFLQALAQDHNALRSGDSAGRVYSWGDRQKAAAFLDAAHQERANDQISAFADMAKEDGHAITDKVLMERAAAHYYEHGGSVDNAIDRAAMALADESPDVRATLTETIPGWEDVVHGGPVHGGSEKPASQGIGGTGRAAEGNVTGARGAVRDAGGARGATDFSAPAAPEPDPALKQASARVGKPADLKALAAEHGVNPETGAFREQADIAQLQAEGRLRPEDVEHLAEADRTFENGQAYGEAMKAAFTCVVAAAA